MIFVFFMAIGNMIGYSIMKIWDVPSEHMLKLMLLLDHHSIFVSATAFVFTSH